MAKRKKEAKNIVLGKGVFKIDGQEIGLTRDGGKFSVEYENRPISADGDRGLVKGRIVREKGQAKLEISHLEILTSFDKLHPGLKVDSSSAPGTTKITGTGKILESDYHDVEWNGETLDGRDVTIKLHNAINLENIEFDLKDKEDILDKVTFTATYDDQAEDELLEPFEINFKTGK